MKKLLLVHGAQSYRLSKLILNSFYEIIALYMTQFCFPFFKNISYRLFRLILYSFYRSIAPYIT